MINLNELNNIISCIGNTPLLEIKSPNPKVRILAKMEMMNPTASIKDRIAQYIIQKAKENGLIEANTHIIEGSSGNTGCSIAMICASLGLPCTIFVPDKASKEKIAFIQSFGAKVIVKPSSGTGEEEYSQAAQIAAEKIKKSYFVNQYNNPWNLEAHYYTTGKEIWEQTEGEIDYFVATGSTGGTICGVSKYLKERSKSIRSILADPAGSVYHDYFLGKEDYLKSAKPYLTEGAGKHHIVDVIDFSLIDDVMQFSDKDAFDMALKIAQTEGISVGGSSGGNAFASYQLAKKLKHRATIVTIFPDSGLKYFSTIYNKFWIEKKIK